jgi:hypothetical protein
MSIYVIRAIKHRSPFLETFGDIISSTSTIDPCHVFWTPLLPVPPSSYQFDRMSFALQLKDIEDKIEAMEQQLLLLKRHRNSLIPVCHLPPELLAHIFSFVQRGVAHSSKNVDPDFEFDKIASDWSRVMRVCTYFRAVAIQTPMLWDVQDFTRPASEWRDLCLSRAAEIPTCVFINQLSHGDHLRHAWKAVVEGDAVHADVLNTAPNLLILAICLNWRPTPFEITPSFFGGSPSITHLSLHGVQLLLGKAPDMPVLRRLVLREIVADLDLEEMAEFFERTPLLENLSLHFIYLGSAREVVNESTVIPVPRRVSLPHLKTLLLEDAPAEASAFVRLLSMPSTTLGIKVAETDDEIRITSNHDLIHEAYMSFAEALPDSAECCAGSITTRGYLLGTVEFGQTLWEHIQLVDPACFLTFSCYVRSQHPLFDRITTFRTQMIPVSGNDMDTIWSSPFLPNLHTIVLEYLNDNDFEHRQEIKDWLGRRGNRIKHVEFDSCSALFLPFCEDLRQEQVVSQVIWR